jgi:hypothetical protein
MFLCMKIRLTGAPLVVVVLDCGVVDKDKEAATGHESQIHVSLFSVDLCKILRG